MQGFPLEIGQEMLLCLQSPSLIKGKKKIRKLTGFILCLCLLIT